MMDFMNSTLFGLWFVAFATLCVSLGMAIKTQMRGLQLQADMVKLLGDLTGIMITQNAHQVQAVPLPNWRQLPPDAQLMMRSSLVEVLREMDREMPARN